MGRLTLSFLGPPEVRHEEHRLTFPTRKALALLIYLAVEAGMQPREKLAPLLWPESSHKAGRASLRSTLALLRKALAHGEDSGSPPHLRVERKAIGFNFEAPHRLDLTTVQQALEAETTDLAAGMARLQTAGELARGTFLEGFSLPDTPRFDAWVAYKQEQWHLRLGRLFDRLSTLEMEAGRPATALETLNRWLALDPLEERAYRQAMAAHVALGDRPGALQRYERCRELLAAELGVEPGPETAALAARIRQRAGKATPPGLTGPGPRRPRPFELPLTGRAEAHSRLVAAYRRAREGMTCMVTVEGEAGIGKTRLARHFLQWAGAQGATVLEGRAFETGGRLSYQPVVDALRSGFPFSVEPAPTWLAPLCRLLPELGADQGGLPAPTGDDATAQRRLFEAVARLGRALSREDPLVLFIDDLQWADTGSRDLLQYVAQRWARMDAPVLLLFSLRSEALARAEAGGVAFPLRDWLIGLGRDLQSSRIEVTPLDKAAVGRLVAALGVPAAQRAALAQWLFAETGGQPFYLAETIEALCDREVLLWERAEGGGQRLRLAMAPGAPSLPPGFVAPGVRETIVGRLERLSGAAFSLLAAGAVLGQEFGYRQLCRVSGVGVEQGLVALDELLSAHLLIERETEPPYLFAHDKIRDVVYTEAGDARRRLFHERAYRVLEESGDAAARLAHHAFAAGLAGPAFRHAVAAGDAARALFAIRDAAGHYGRARSLLQDQPALRARMPPAQIHHLYRRLVRSHELLDEWEAARERAEEMLAAADEIEAAGMRVTALNRLAAVAIQSRLDVEKATELLEAAATLAEREGDRRGLAETEWNLAQACFHRRDRTGAVAHGERALRLAKSLGRPALTARSHNIISYARTGPAPPAELDEAKAHAAAGRQLYAKLGNRAMEMDCLNLLGAIEIHRGEPAAAAERLRRAWRASEEIGNLWGQANSAFNLAQALLELGRYGEAVTTAEAAVAAARKGKPTPLLAGALSVRGAAYRALLAPEKALADHLAADEIFASIPNPNISHMMAADLCADYGLLGNWEEAQRRARRALERERKDAWLFSGFHEWLLVKALLRGGDERLAREAVRAFGALVGGNPRYQIPHRRALALLAEQAGDLARTRTELEAALVQAEALGLPGERWQLLAALADVQRAAGQAQQAERTLARALAVVRELAHSIDKPELRERFLATARGRLPTEEE